MTQRDRLIISGLVFAVLAGAMWFMLVAPKREEAAKLRDQIASTQSDLATAKQQNAAAAAARRNYGQDIKALGALARALPDDDQTAALLYQLNRAAGSADIKLKSISPSTVGATDPTSGTAVVPLPAGVQEMKLDLTFEGRYADLQRFLDRLQSATSVDGDNVKVSGRLISVRGVQLQGDTSKPGGVTATVSASAYVNAPVTATTPGQPGATTATPGAATPTAPATSTPAPATSTPAPATSTPAPATTAPPAQSTSTGAGA